MQYGPQYLFLTLAIKNARAEHQHQSNRMAIEVTYLTEEDIPGAVKAVQCVLPHVSPQKFLV